MWTGGELLLNTDLEYKVNNKTQGNVDWETW